MTGLADQLQVAPENLSRAAMGLPPFKAIEAFLVAAQTLGFANAASILHHCSSRQPPHSGS